jgi:NAD(P)-dependent dehydrogenase (short-subunit alcohol dehydrogenase family)
MGRITGKSVVITGAGSGIGRAASLLFAAEGARLVIADRMDTVHETADLVKAAGGTAVSVTGDAGDEGFVESLVARAVTEHGGLDGVWANAGISGGWTPMEEQDAAFWAEVLRVNLIGPFLAIKHAMPHMIKQRYGAIVCTASVAGLKSGASGHPYAACFLPFAAHLAAVLAAGTLGVEAALLDGLRADLCSFLAANAMPVCLGLLDQPPDSVAGSMAGARI